LVENCCRKERAVHNRIEFTSLLRLTALFRWSQIEFGHGVCHLS
jgi:hypothetical protein